MPKPAVLVSGCAGGLGASICQQFAEAGYAVIGLDRLASSHAGLDAFYQCDLLHLVGDASARDQLSGWLTDKLTRKALTLNCLINNAAIQILGSSKELSSHDLIESFTINVAAAFSLSQLALGSLERSKGSIINIGSIHAKLTKPGFTAYATSKAALRGLTQSMAQDLRQRVRVNLVEPAAIDTPMLREGFTDNPQGLAELNRYHPIGRVAQPAEIAQLALFLASDNAKFLTGGTFPADGGIGSSLHDPAACD